MNSLRFEYRNNGIILRVLLPNEFMKSLQFYAKNKDSFDCYEIKKPDGFYTPDFQEKILKAEYENFIRGNSIRYFLFDERFPDDIIGCISFFDIKHSDFEQCVTGYKIDEEYRRMGYGTKMLSLATHIITHDFGIHRVEAYIMPSNKPSVRLAQNCGYEAEGIAKGYVRLNGEWIDHLRYVYVMA